MQEDFTMLIITITLIHFKILQFFKQKGSVIVDVISTINT